MRLWHLVILVAALAVGLTLLRDPIGRVFVIVLFTGVGELMFGLATLMALFQTVGAMGEAKAVVDHAGALAATGAVLCVGTAVMSGWLFVGAWCVLMFA